MLNLPSNRQLDDAAATATNASTAFPAPANSGFPAPAATAPTTPTTPTANTSGGLLSNNPRPWNSQTTPAAGSAQAAASDSSGSSAGDKAAVILAWVLLFSSVAGNVYLFWSYLDVRTKYRSLVRKTARAVGSRFSAA
jgi:hypothetical protein